MAEAACGMLAAFLGVVLLVLALFADTITSVRGSAGAIAACAQAPCPPPTYNPPSATVVTHTSIAAGGISATLEVVIGVVVLVLLAIAVGAIMHGLSRRVPWLVLLCFGTALMLLITVVTGLSIGLLFAPADALAVAAVALGLTQPGPALSSRTPPRG
jgi:hypothetical protein